MRDEDTMSRPQRFWAWVERNRRELLVIGVALIATEQVTVRRRLARLEAGR